VLNALTIDLEDWYHPELVRHRLPVSDPGESRTQSCPEASKRSGAWEPQIEQATQHLLDLLEEQHIQATFFVVGQIAQCHPQLIERIVAQGHELACHGMSHRPLWEMTPAEFKHELQEFAETVATVAPSVQVLGFRAPTFSLDNRTGWALSVLAELGYRYDSSIFPLRTPLYGVTHCPLMPYRPSPEDVCRDKGETIIEFPMSVWTWAGVRVPVCGGFYLRALPFGFVKFCLRQINLHRPFVIYVHPWETSLETPRIPLSLPSRIATYYNIGHMKHRLVDLLNTFSFAPMRTVLEEMGELSR